MSQRHSPSSLCSQEGIRAETLGKAGLALGLSRRGAVKTHRRRPFHRDRTKSLQFIAYGGHPRTQKSLLGRASCAFRLKPETTMEMESVRETLRRADEVCCSSPSQTLQHVCADNVCLLGDKNCIVQAVSACVVFVGYHEETMVP